MLALFTFLAKFFGLADLLAGWEHDRAEQEQGEQRHARADLEQGAKDDASARQIDDAVDRLTDDQLDIELRK